jgi:hypothetical protein
MASLYGFVTTRLCVGSKLPMLANQGIPPTRSYHIAGSLARVVPHEGVSHDCRFFGGSSLDLGPIIWMDRETYKVASGGPVRWLAASQYMGRSALIGDLRRDAPREELDQITQAIPSTLMRWGMRHSVAEAYTKAELAELLRQTLWSDFEIVEDTFGLTITLWK